MRFIVTCDPVIVSNSEIKRALHPLGMRNTSVVRVNTEGLVSERRVANMPTIHLLYNGVIACGVSLSEPIEVISDPAEVTCTECMSSPTFGQALDNS